MVAKIADHHEYRGYFSRVGRRILEGMNAADAYLREQNAIPHDGELITANVRLGEKVRDLPRLLDEYADERDDDVQMMVDVLPRMLDPIILIILSLGVGGMMMAIYYPYFGLLQKIIEQIN
jgi:type IV pilus assembly protein PilC